VVSAVNIDHVLITVGGEIVKRKKESLDGENDLKIHVTERKLASEDNETQKAKLAT